MYLWNQPEKEPPPITLWWWIRRKRLTPRSASSNRPFPWGYDPEDRKRGCSGYVPVTLQYRPYEAKQARLHSLAGGDPLETSDDRSYRGKWNTAANEEDLDLVIETKKRMAERPVIVSVNLKTPW